MSSLPFLVDVVHHENKLRRVHNYILCLAVVSIMQPTSPLLLIMLNEQAPYLPHDIACRHLITVSSSHPYCMLHSNSICEARSANDLSSGELLEEMTSGGMLPSFVLFNSDRPSASKFRTL